MKNAVRFGKVGGVVFGFHSFANQFFENTLLEPDFSVIFWETVGGIVLAGMIGLSMDVYAWLSPKKVIPPLAQKVWKKGKWIFGLSPSVWRKTKYGRLIKYSEYGNRQSEYGWEIEHAKPKAAGGSDHISNLFPEHWYENVLKGSKYPYKKKIQID